MTYRGRRSRIAGLMSHQSLLTWELNRPELSRKPVNGFLGNGTRSGTT
jgi:hypothetical protein